MSDLNTFYRNTEPWIAAAAHSKYGHPVSDRELLDRLSPLLRVDALTAPLLLVHGGNDTNVPPSESEQMYDALRALGRTVSYWSSTTTVTRSTKRENRAVLAEPCANGSSPLSPRAPMSVTIARLREKVWRFAAG